MSPPPGFYKFILRHLCVISKSKFSLLHILLSRTFCRRPP
nr:MAG TPA: hypothetical protein [Caudoviricetes sp.]